MSVRSGLSYRLFTLITPLITGCTTWQNPALLTREAWQASLQGRKATDCRTSARGKKNISERLA